MSARKLHPRLEYIYHAIAHDDEFVELLNRCADECFGVSNFPIDSHLELDDDFSDNVKKTEQLLTSLKYSERFPISEDDFFQILFTGEPLFAGDSSMISSSYNLDGFAQVTIHGPVSREDYINEWNKIKPYVKGIRNRGPDDISLIYAVKKSKIAGLTSKEISTKLAKGELALYAKTRNLESHEIDDMLYRSKKYLGHN